MFSELSHVVSILRRSAVTLGVAAAAVVVFALGDLTVLLEGNRAAVGRGQWWRLVTGHFTHFGADHLFWDLSMFVVLGVLAELADRRRFVWTMIVSAVAISAAVALVQPDIDTYRGLSGIDSALFVGVCLSMLREARGRDESWMRAGLVLLLTGFVAKVGYEFATDRCLFVSATDFTPVPLAHVVGAATACVFWGWNRETVRQLVRWRAQSLQRAQGLTSRGVPARGPT
jgi:rhomboid family GlyGly-CTERM serine protease